MLPRSENSTRPPAPHKTDVPVRPRDSPPPYPPPSMSNQKGDRRERELVNKLNNFFITETAFTPDHQTQFDFTSDGEDVHLLGQKAQDMLDAYRLLPQFSESSLVNLALSTGLLSQALDLDVERVGTAPVTVASTFDFSFRPHPAQPTVFRHNNGQVEVDACFVSRRNGEQVLVVVEAKTGPKRSLAKHKLFYPLMSVRAQALASGIDVLPVYLRAQYTGNSVDYDIYECTPFSVEEPEPYLSDVTAYIPIHRCI